MYQSGIIIKRDKVKKADRKKKKTSFAAKFFNGLVSFIVLFISAISLFHGLKEHYLNTFIFGALCAFIALHHILITILLEMVNSSKK